MMIYTFGDGYAAGHIWPEWPQILQALLPDCTVINTAAVGAGPEWLVHKFVELVPVMQNSTVIFQWPQADRFDKLLEDPWWKAIADSDAVYDFNQYNSWWLSSASNSPKVKQYHREFIQSQQHQVRLNTYQVLVKNTLENLNCKYIETSTKDQESYSRRSEFNSIRQQEIQPSPAVHFEWVMGLGLDISKTRANKLKTLIDCQEWTPYYHDRELVWTTILAELNNPNT